MNELNVIQIRLNAPKNRYNSFFKGNYRSAEDILEPLKPLLKETGCTVVCTDEIVSIEGRLFVRATATLRNPDGEGVSAAGFAELRAAGETRDRLDPAQLTGSASSYARKYALNGLFAIDDNRDPDDEEMTRAREEGAKTQTKTKAKTQGRPRKLTREDWDRMVESETEGKKTRDGERIRDWWIRAYRPGETQIRMFDEACLRKVGETVERTGTLPAGARQIMDDRDAGAATQQTADDMPDSDKLFDNA